MSKKPDKYANISYIKKESLVSIIIPTFNRKWLVGRSIDSVLTQSYKNLELILVNDSGEDVQDVVDKFNDPRIKYFQNEKNLGLAGTRNVGLKNSSGEYICFLDDDDILYSLSLEVKNYLIKKLNTEIVYTQALQDIWEKTEQGYVSKHKQLYWQSPFNRDLILIQNIAPCCCPLFSRKAWDDSGNYLFDETMTTSEDHDFWCALSRKTDFYELKLVDAECSFRTDKSQMTGSLNFAPNWIKIFKKWRHTALDLEGVTQSQNDILKRVGLKPEEYGL
jgi:glycosyltransferase involved in cell wall biosynthesis